MLFRSMQIVADGGLVDGRRYLSEALLKEALTPQYEGDTEIFGYMSFGLGFGLHNHNFPSPTPTSVHWGGSGGFWAMADPTQHVAIAYAMNRGLEPDFSEDELELMDPRQLRFWDVMSELVPCL